MAHIIDEPIEEGLLPGNRLRYFHPTKPGEVLDGRFKTIAKLGFGAGSTVWLAENLRFIKIAALDTVSSREMTCWKLITTTNPSHEGLSFLRTPVDQFQLEGPEGMHLCLVYEPMRETLFQLQQRARRQRLALPLFKLFIYCLLEALDYLHTECHIIHADIKDDNIMVTIENDTILTDFVDSQSKAPQAMHIREEDDRAIYLSKEDFGPLRCPWSYSVDIWSLGLLMWNLLEDVSLFDRPAGEDGEYDGHVHLAQMTSLLGEPPEELIKRERLFREHRLDRPVLNSRGEEFRNMNEFWGGPFFDDNGQILRNDIVKRSKKLADTVTELAGDEKEIFLDFASGMLHWLPEKRKTAKELLQHPFFDSLYKDRARYL
ncbi:uncharacterized protein TRIVIDRAFT_193504 [Trichoderma virens Gv29-8]|uniref:non-specific serine/threonine protein kinase n=1 Tax=Hypocrea virens (strain Gv29-8 / FGSC 10586) TaxID=413071 RepID=G9N1K2_HYPVG|nr:uncharacterized protein TRIVIDRAFT_193504 [Trichoderma virens Gv29-8]EHK19632.1 hypothetical protein TRIVIDRAFT_193504 [Trichoderma virens Gv29-8]UKZ58112.1 hypothetical protein TrVGV298_011977 [Trichoderma virens]